MVSGVANSSAPSTRLGGLGSYGKHILSTGGALEQWELLFGRYLYESRFAGKTPILDLAAGRCWFTKQNPAAIVAVDIEPAIVERYAAEGIDIRLGDAYDLPFPDDHFEGVFCCWLFEHLTDCERAMTEIRRVLRPGGYACLIVPSAESLLAGFFDDYTHVRPFTEVSLAQLAKAGGFSRFATSYLVHTRGARHVLRWFGPEATLQRLRLMDAYGRRVGIVNRGNLMLEAWK